MMNDLGSGPEGAAHISDMTNGSGLGAETTSSLERYLAEISDPTLRENLAREIGGLQRQFGLVFERHHPEGIRLPKHAVRKNSKVVVASRKDSVFHRVQEVKKTLGTAVIVDAEGAESEHALAELTVAKEFGDIMYPGLRKLSEIRRGDPDAPVHTIINGENYHALEALQYTHAGKVDLIYIDPPYNTGNADWKYNDRYVDAKDGYRHSKWLSFMEKRLTIAKSLLKATGFVAISIDDSEHARLKVLADQILGPKNYAASLIWKSKSGGANDSDIAVEHEYVLIYRASELSVIRSDEMGTATTSYSRTEPDGRRYSLERLDKQNLSYSGALDYTITGPDGLSYDLEHKNPLKPNAIWRWGKDTVTDRFDELVFEKGHVYTKNYAKDSYTPRSLLVDERFGRTRTGGTDLAKILGDKRFTFPKPAKLIEHLLRVLAPENAVVLDFFGGSGTTADAALRMNSQDGGTRQAILVTNNELSKADDTKLRKAGHAPGDSEYEALGVFHHVTKPRLETVVTGIRQDGSTYSDGLDANIAFFELTYLDEPEIVRGAAFDDLAGLFWLKAGGIGGTLELTTGAKADGFAISESGKTAVLFSTGRAKALAEKLASTEHSISHLFIVTKSEAQGDEAALHFSGGITVERIYGSYLEAFQVNRKD